VSSMKTHAAFSCNMVSLAVPIPAPLSFPSLLSPPKQRFLGRYELKVANGAACDQQSAATALVLAQVPLAADPAAACN
jgi:hypothetical protein